MWEERKKGCYPEGLLDEQAFGREGREQARFIGSWVKVGTEGWDFRGQQFQALRAGACTWVATVPLPGIETSAAYVVHCLRP